MPFSIAAESPWLQCPQFLVAVSYPRRWGPSCLDAEVEEEEFSCERVVTQSREARPDARQET